MNFDYLNMISTELIQKLRAETGVGMMDVKKALEEAQGDENKAREILRQMGQKIAFKKQNERIAKDGLIEPYVHANGKMAAMVMLSSETDFVAKNEIFKNLAHDLAMQVAGLNPSYISDEEIPAEIIEQEKENYRQELAKENKPAEIIEKIIEGKLNKFYEEVCLLNQKFIKDDTKTVKNLIEEHITKLGEKIEIKKIIRWQI